MEGPRTSAEIARARREHAQPSRAETEHLKYVRDLDAYLKEHGHADTCETLYANVKCDPWKYEPILLKDLMGIRRTGDRNDVRLIRELIRAGSWMSYGRVYEKDVLEGLKDLTRMEEQDWEQRIRHSDPDTAKELKQNQRTQSEELHRVAHAIENGLLGAALEKPVETIEDLDVTAWNGLERMRIARGMSWSEAREDVNGKMLVKEIETIRPIRDFLYFNLLYPDKLKALIRTGS